MKVFILFLFLLVSVSSYAIDCKVAEYDESTTNTGVVRKLIRTTDNVIVTSLLKDKDVKLRPIRPTHLRPLGPPFACY